MSAPQIGVLAVMKEAAEDVVGGDVGLRLLKAAESVAELIEATNAYANAKGLPVSVMHARLRRIRAALARVQGDAA
jgi:hypothetical protein